MIKLTCDAIIPNCPLKDISEIEESIRSIYRKNIYTKFVSAIIEYNLIEKGDKIAIGVSGGKDSLLLVKLFQELKKDKRFDFEFKAISLNPGFREDDLNQFKYNLEKLNIDCEIIDTNIWKVANDMAKENPCFLCAKMRRGLLYKNIEELGYKKLALGHHFDDVIETTLINMFYAGSLKTMLPITKSTTGDLTLIRPLVMVYEKDIITYTKNNGIRAMNCGCTIEAGKTASKRKEIKLMLKDLEEKNPGIKQKIFKSMENIHLDYVYGYKTKEKKFNIKTEDI